MLNLIHDLTQPDAFDHPVDDITVLQTHISWVVLAGDRVYKVKKPVDFGFLDFSTLRKRRYYCHQEVSLNRRLCADLYLGVVPIRLDGEHVRVNGSRGRIVEYAVKMRRLPQDRMLDHLLAAGGVAAADIDQIASRMARFHAEAETGPQVNRSGSSRVIRRNWIENFDQTESFIGNTISQEQFDFLRAWFEASMRRMRSTFRQRVAEGRIRDGHGDLRASAICMIEPACIFDCIEFNERFRHADVAADIAFLAMDLEAKGHAAFAELFVERYIDESGDAGLREVLDFYLCYRAFVRGKVEGFLAVDESAPANERESAADTARDRFAQAVRAARRAHPPVLLITCGLSGTGKSAVAGALADVYGMEIVASDAVRKGLAGVAPGEHAPDDFEQGIYSASFTRRTYQAMLRRASEAVEQGSSVVLDATFSSRAWRDAAARVAREYGALFLCLEYRLDESVARERINARTRSGSSVSDATWETYLNQRERFEPVAELSRWEHLVLDTGGTLDDTIVQARAMLDSRLDPRGTVKGSSGTPECSEL